MNLRNFALFGASLLIAGAAHAQAGLYATVTAQRISNIPYSTGTTTATGGEVNPLGGTFGAYYDFKNLGPVRLGVDGRGVITRTPRGVLPTANGSGTHLFSVLGGVRASFHTPIHLLRPYVEGAAGYARTDYGEPPDSPQPGVITGVSTPLYKAFEYHGYAGLDLAVAPLLDVRLFELGYGGLSGSGPTNQSQSYPVKSISVGIVFHLPR